MDRKYSSKNPLNKRVFEYQESESMVSANINQVFSH